MGKYEEIKDRSGEHFRRLTGVRKTAFLKMAEAVVTHENERKKNIRPSAEIKLWGSGSDDARI